MEAVEILRQECQCICRIVVVGDAYQFIVTNVSAYPNSHYRQLIIRLKHLPWDSDWIATSIGMTVSQQKNGFVTVRSHSMSSLQDTISSKLQGITRCRKTSSVHWPGLDVIFNIILTGVSVLQVVQVKCKLWARSVSYHGQFVGFARNEFWLKSTQ